MQKHIIYNTSKRYNAQANQIGSKSVNNEKHTLELTINNDSLSIINDDSSNMNLTNIISIINSEFNTNGELRKELMVLFSKFNVNELTKLNIHNFIDPRKCVTDKYGNKEYYSYYNENTKQHEKGDLLNSYEYVNELGIKTTLPALEYETGKYWYINGKLHRTDGPAIEYSDGSKEWYINGEQHRTDGPAVECPNGYRTWYINGIRHRTDGPAIKYSDGRNEWYINGKNYTEEEYKIKIKIFKKIEKLNKNITKLQSELLYLEYTDKHIIN